jgi:hypothetical protein
VKFGEAIPPNVIPCNIVCILKANIIHGNDNIRFIIKDYYVTLASVFITYIYIHTTLYPLRGSRGISNILPRHPRFNKFS